MKTITKTIEVPIADKNGVGIYVGSVLKRIDEPTTGVVIRIIKKEDRVAGPAYAGDLEIQISAGVYRVTNAYAEWEHVPKDEQTYSQRYMSWLYTPYFDLGLSERTSEEQIAVEGILSLIPDAFLDENEFSYDLTEALRLMADYLEKIKEEVCECTDWHKDYAGLRCSDCGKKIKEGK